MSAFPATNTPSKYPTTATPSAYPSGAGSQFDSTAGSQFGSNYDENIVQQIVSNYSNYSNYDENDPNAIHIVTDGDAYVSGMDCYSGYDGQSGFDGVSGCYSGFDGAVTSGYDTGDTWEADGKTTSEDDSSSSDDDDGDKKRAVDNKKANVNMLLEQMQEDAITRREDREEGGLCSFGNMLWVGIFFLGAYMFYTKVIKKPVDPNKPEITGKGKEETIEEEGAKGQKTCGQTCIGACSGSCKSCCVSLSICCVLIVTVTCVMFSDNVNSLSGLTQVCGNTWESLFDSLTDNIGSLKDDLADFVGDVCPCAHCCCNGNCCGDC